ncbi:hypothetical protein SCWH03_58160 [Streptomyces pacificus]|uniref:Uncharacterized protein n=1 Tax=Streptomyces pacificus TaxID=2705029 RepID=A0A6A0B4Y3_9ACTN|nr:hypothetical protein SCWH03_58160 [Streptomyces pacificus]
MRRPGPRTDQAALRQLFDRPPDRVGPPPQLSARASDTSDPSAGPDDLLGAPAHPVALTHHRAEAVGVALLRGKRGEVVPVRMTGRDAGGTARALAAENERRLRLLHRFRQGGTVQETEVAAVEGEGALGRHIPVRATSLITRLMPSLLVLL